MSKDLIIKALEEALNVSRETLEVLSKIKVGEIAYAVYSMGISPVTVGAIEITACGCFIRDTDDEVVATGNNIFTTREDAIKYYNNRYEIPRHNNSKYIH